MDEASRGRRVIILDSESSSPDVKGSSFPKAEKAISAKKHALVPKSHSIESHPCEFTSPPF